MVGEGSCQRGVVEPSVEPEVGVLAIISEKKGDLLESR